jgi:hypothetical protein
MNIIKRLDRVTQWAGEKIGQEQKTGASDEFKALEMEMTLRHEGKSARCYFLCRLANISQEWTNFTKLRRTMSSPSRNAAKIKTRRRFCPWDTWGRR